jgi:predicted molibdopterin-dependent oxidoreductase YjgC
MVEAAELGGLDVLYASGGNFLDVLPDPAFVERALRRVPLRVHQDVVLSSQMLVPPPAGGEVVLLPAATRYEQEGGGTETTTERRIIFSPEIPGHRVGEARSEWRVFADLAARVRPDLATAFAWPDNQALRAEIARVAPLYAGIETLRRSGDSVQYGGRHLALPHRRFRPVDGVGAAPRLGEGEFFVSTRRGKQFNSMIHASADPLNGARRDDVLMDEADARAHGLGAGDAITLVSATGRLAGRVKLARLPSRTLQVHWPEGNVLLAGGPANREPRSQVPDYNAVVRIEGGRRIDG